MIFYFNGGTSERVVNGLQNFNCSFLLGVDFIKNKNTMKGIENGNSDLFSVTLTIKEDKNTIWWLKYFLQSYKDQSVQIKFTDGEDVFGPAVDYEDKYFLCNYNLNSFSEKADDEYYHSISLTISCKSYSTELNGAQNEIRFIDSVSTSFPKMMYQYGYTNITEFSGSNNFGLKVSPSDDYINTRNASKGSRFIANYTQKFLCYDDSQNFQKYLMTVARGNVITWQTENINIFGTLVMDPNSNDVIIASFRMTKVFGREWSANLEIVNV